MVENALLNKLIRLNNLQTVILTAKDMGNYKELETKVDFNDDNSVTIQFREVEE